MAIIKADKVNIAYDGINVVTDLSFEVKSGDYLCIIGENGSGKSTLVKAILGLKNISSGTLSFGDGLKQKEIGYLPQQTPAQKDFPASVYEVVLSGTLGGKGLFSLYNSNDRRNALDNMATLGITSLKNKCYRQLSGGQQQRVLLARALCATKKLLLLDEPVTGLDPVATQEMYELIHHLNKDHGITVIMVSHDLGASLKYSDKILHMHNTGAYFGLTSEYLSSEAGKRFAGGEDNA